MSYGPNDPMNPYQAPLPGGPGLSLALAKVKGPAIGLLVTAGIGILLQLLNLVWAVVQGNAPPPQLPPDADPQAAEMVKNLAMISGTMGMVFAVIGMLTGVLVILGALKMMKLGSYGLAMAAAIVAMVPCVSPCCVLGIPFGIWALVALNDANVKASFR